MDNSNTDSKKFVIADAKLNASSANRTIKSEGRIGRRTLLLSSIVPYTFHELSLLAFASCSGITEVNFAALN
jgi:hypothetical protein